MPLNYNQKLFEAECRQCSTTQFHVPCHHPNMASMIRAWTNVISRWCGAEQMEPMWPNDNTRTHKATRIDSINFKPLTTVVCVLIQWPIIIMRANSFALMMTLLYYEWTEPCYYCATCFTVHTTVVWYHNFVLMYMYLGSRPHRSELHSWFTTYTAYIHYTVGFG